MTIKELFVKPLDRSINGVVKADQDDNDTVYQELDEYIVTNELERHFRAFFESYGTSLDDPSIANRVGVWISGFFGSGKSHFLKILSFILANREVQDSEGNRKTAVEFFDESKIRDATIRADVAKAVTTPTDVILFNIDSKASSNDDGNPILNVFLRVFNEHQGFSGDHPHVAHMERHLAEKGVYDAFKESFTKHTDAKWEEERDGYHFFQDGIEKALSEALDLSPEAANKWFEESEDTFSVSVENFCEWVKEYLAGKSADHRILFLVDEVGQFIGSDTKLMLTLQTITENLGTICRGRAWIIVTSQADMDAVLGELSASKANDFSKIAGRFKTRLSLSSSNADEVIQKRLLKKTAAAEAELRAVFDKKGDVLKNQISFDRSGPNLKNFDGPESFVSDYPFAPYHFQLVQKVFEEIRKVGATGAHLAFGERSMLDAFQMAAKAVSGEEVGKLIAMYQFYPSVEGFLDPAVKNTIDQAASNATLDEFDGKMLRTLFMIRYVDLVKGTLNNLVTLSIEKIDEDKLALRARIEESLQRLEKQSLIIRSGDDYQFLTNEERDVSRKIKSTDIASSEENQELGNLIFKDLLRDKNKFRYSVNKMDYSIGRYLDGHTLDGRQETDLRVEVISPLDVDYSRYSEAMCINKSGDGNGTVLLCLPDHESFFTELRIWLQTNKFIRMNTDDSQADIARILADRGRENQERKKRLRFTLEEMLSKAEFYALGQHLKLSNSTIASTYDESCEYLLVNTYTKLAYLKVLQQDPYRELSAVLKADDIGQLGLTLDGEEGNPLATKEVEQYISLRAGSDRVLVSDIVDNFSKRPFGWLDAETLLIVGRLAAAGRVSFQKSGGTLPPKEAFEPLQNSRTRREISVIKKRRVDEVVLKDARSLTKDLFSVLGPETEKELYEFYRQRLESWLTDLTSYKSKLDVGRFPGKSVIESSVLSLQRLLNNDDSFDFFKQVVDNKNEYLDLEEDYRDLHDFYTNQLSTWQQLHTALSQFSVNAPALEKNQQASEALSELKAIADSETPYSMLHKVAAKISVVGDVNEKLLNEKRTHAISRVDEKIKQLEGEIAKSSIATAELSNKLLRPLQLVKAELDSTVSIPNIFMLQKETADERLDDSLSDLEQAIRDAAQKAKTPADPKGVEEPSQPVVPVSAPKEVADVSVAKVFSSVSNSVYLESQADIDKFVDALKKELEAAINKDQRVRIR
jgi:hypothetical protein